MFQSQGLFSKKSRNISILRGGLCIKQAASYENFDKIFLLRYLHSKSCFYAIVSVLPTKLRNSPNQELATLFRTKFYHWHF